MNMSVSQLQIGTFQDTVISLGRVVVGLDRFVDHPILLRGLTKTRCNHSHGNYTCDKLPPCGSSRRIVRTNSVLEFLSSCALRTSRITGSLQAQVAVLQSAIMGH